VLFTGAHEHSVDAKHRLAIPAAVRNQLRSAGSADALYIHVGANGALWLWPEPTFEKMAGDVEPSLSPDPELQEFDELTFPDTHRAEFDSAGRVTIPDQMLAEAGLGNKVVIIGMRHHMEVRDPEQWQQHRQHQIAKRREIAQRASGTLRREKLEHRGRSERSGSDTGQSGAEQA